MALPNSKLRKAAMKTEIQENLERIRRTLPSHVTLVAVSKFHPVGVLREAYDAGQRIFGESRVQELQEKVRSLPADIEWHFIGHLQVNKVKYIAPYVSLIHAVDSIRLLREIDRQGGRVERVIPCLLQLHVAREETKFGFSMEECRRFLQDGEWRALRHVRIEGLMCMASNTSDTGRVRADFRAAHDFFEELRSTVFSGETTFSKCSWGMSGDYGMAIGEGSTMVRIGSAIFGERV